MLRTALLLLLAVTATAAEKRSPAAQEEISLDLDANGQLTQMSGTTALKPYACVASDLVGHEEYTLYAESAAVATTALNAAVLVVRKHPRHITCKLAD